MGFFTQLLQPEKRALKDIPELKGWLFADPTASGVDVTPESALSMLAVFACIRVLSEGLAQLPLILYRRLPNGGKERATDEPLYTLLHDLPNGEMTSFSFRETLMGHLGGWGNGYAEIEFNGAGDVAGLWPLRPDLMTVERNGTGLVYAYDRKPVPAYKIFHVPGLGYDGRVGYSPIAIARQAIGLGMAAEQFSARFFKNDGRPGIVLEHPGHLGEDAYNNLKKSWLDEHGGVANAHSPAILEEGLKIHEIGLPGEDVQFLATRKFQREEIAGLYRVPPHLIADLERATFCIPADTEVYTANGPKRVVEVRLGELVWSRRDGGGLVLSRVEQAGPSGVDKILRIKTTNRTIRLNDKHRVLTRRAVEHSSKPGELGGRNRDGQKFRLEWITEYVPAGELRIGNTIVAFNGTPDSGNWDLPMRRATVGFMEFCGLYMGDGWMTHGQVTLARAKSATYMDHYRKVMRQEFIRYAGGNGRGDKRDVRKSPVTLCEAERSTRFASVMATTELKTLGFSGTAHEKRVPDLVFGLADELKLAFLRGFLDADGSVDKKGRISFSSCSKELMTGIRHLCMSLGIPVTNVTERIGMTSLPNGKRTPVHQYAITCSDPGENRRIGSHDLRYIERLQNGQPFDRKSRHYPRYGGRDFSEPGAELSRIVAIEIEGEEPVYDLTVAGTHSFIADGVIVHNSNIEQQSLEFVIYSLTPWLVQWEQTITWKLIPPARRRELFAEFLVDGLLRGDTQSRFQAYSVGRQNGWLSANDVRERENMNPIEGGDVYLIPMNMMPANDTGQSASAGGTPGGVPQTARTLIPSPSPGGRGELEERSYKSARARNRLGHAYKRMYADVMGRVIRREQADIRKAVTRYLGKRDVMMFNSWLDQFYRDHRPFVKKNVTPLYHSYMDAVAQLAQDEVNATEQDMTRELERFTSVYTDDFSDRHSDISYNRMRGAVQRALDSGENPADAVEAELTKWDDRPDDTAMWESVRFGSAIAVTVFSLAGRKFLRWHAFGDSCPYCKDLNGKKVGINEFFLEIGDYKPEGADKPLTLANNVRHPPAHGGCDCAISAA